MLAVVETLHSVWGCPLGIARQGGLLPPFSTAYVKGWKRGTMLLTTLEAIRVLNLEESIEHWIKALGSWSLLIR